MQKTNINASMAAFVCQGLSVYNQLLTLLHLVRDTGSHKYAKCMPWKSALKQIVKKLLQ